MCFLNAYIVVALAAIGFLVVTARVIYPDADEFERNCLLADDSSYGVCKKLKNCPSAVTANVDPITCYFEGFEQFVCCERNAVDDGINIFGGLAHQACENFYPRRHALVNGLVTKPREFPYMVAVGWESPKDKNTFVYKCGGVLIESNFVLTAAHCAYVNGNSPVVVLPGGPNLTDVSAKTYSIANIFVHPAYKPDSSYHDIAIIQTKELIRDENKACMWPIFKVTNSNVTVIGYGDTKFAGESSPQLLKAQLQVISNEECAEYYGSEDKIPNGIIKSQLCAKDPERLRDTCQGDSGGPLIMEQNVFGFIRPQIVGLTSFGQGCAGEPPGVYTRVSEYINWIESIVWPGD